MKGILGCSTKVASLDLQEALHECLDKLTPQQKLAIHLRFWEGREIAQIAVIMRASWEYIDKLLARTYVELRILLEKHQAESARHAA